MGESYLDYEADYISKVHAQDIEDLKSLGCTINELYAVDVGQGLHLRGAVEPIGIGNADA